jgi:multicomponent Na+:H+ antiporter subunit F
MSADPSPLLSVAVSVVMAILSVGLFLAFGRLVRGPSLPDRVVALDLTATLVVGVIVVYGLAMRQPVLLDVAMVMALVGFLGAVAFAYYVERGATR